jgi:hypothetical protein
MPSTHTNHLYHSRLDRAMGFVPLSERQSGLTRKAATAPATDGAA